MSLVTRAGARSILSVFSAYLALCGLSAIVLPSSWLWVSGLSTTVSNELGLTFGVIGAYMLALSAGAFLASFDPIRHSGITLTLVIAQVCDFLVTLRAVFQGSLPALNGTGFLIVTVLWMTLLFLAWRTQET